MSRPTDFREYLRILRRRKVIIGVLTLLCALSALGMSLSAIPIYQAEARLLVLAKTQPSGGVSSAYEGALLSQQLVKSFTEMLRSRATAEAALRLDPQPLTPRELQSKVDAEPILDTLLIKLTVRDDDPKRAQRLANTVARAFILNVPNFQGSSTLRVNLVEPALRPTTPISPRTKVNVALGLLLGLFLGYGLAVLREQMDTSVKSPEALEEATNLPVVGTLPVFKVGKEPIPVSTRPRSVEAEAFRKLRTNFAFLGIDRESFCCLVTSPMPGEGKSTVTANLAVALAQAGQRVAIVEADLRKPVLHKVFDLHQRVGTTTVLLDQVNVHDALQNLGPDFPVVLTSGQVPPNPSELLGSQSMAELLAELRSTFDVVLVDCAPLLPVADPMVVSQFTDGILLVARSGVTSRDQLAAAKTTCAKARATVFGTVLNAAVVAEGDQRAYYTYYGEANGQRIAVRAAPDLVPGNGTQRAHRSRAARHGRSHPGVH